MNIIAELEIQNLCKSGAQNLHLHPCAKSPSLAERSWSKRMFPKQELEEALPMSLGGENSTTVALLA